MYASGPGSASVDSGCFADPPMPPEACPVFWKPGKCANYVPGECMKKHIKGPSAGKCKSGGKGRNNKKKFNSQ